MSARAPGGPGSEAPALRACAQAGGEPARPCSDPVSWARPPCPGRPPCSRSASAAQGPGLRGVLGAPGWCDVPRAWPLPGNTLTRRHGHTHVIRGVSLRAPLRAPGPHAVPAGSAYVSFRALTSCVGPRAVLPTPALPLDDLAPPRPGPPGSPPGPTFLLQARQGAWGLSLGSQGHGGPGWWEGASAGQGSRSTSRAETTGRREGGGGQLASWEGSPGLTSPCDPN